MAADTDRLAALELEITELKARLARLESEVHTPDPDQAYYWAPEWQAGERAAEADLQAGRFQTFTSIDDMLVALDDPDRA